MTFKSLIELDNQSRGRTLYKSLNSSFAGWLAGEETKLRSQTTIIWIELPGEGIINAKPFSS